MKPILFVCVENANGGQMVLGERVKSLPESLR